MSPGLLSPDRLLKLALKVLPGAAHNRVAGWLGGELKLRVSASPEKGRANKAVIALLAQQLGIPAQQISILSGHASAHKVVEIPGLTESQLRELLPSAVL